MLLILLNGILFGKMKILLFILAYFNDIKLILLGVFWNLNISTGINVFFGVNIICDCLSEFLVLWKRKWLIS